MKFVEYLKTRAGELKRDLLVLHWALRHPDTPWYAKGLAACVVAYALSPIDLIPDFIPVVGYLDDLLLVPLGIYTARWMIPESVIDECRRRAAETLVALAPSRAAAAAIIILWLAVMAAAAGRIFVRCQA